MPPVPQDQQYMNQYGQQSDGMHHFFNGPRGGFLMMVLFFLVVAAAILILAAMRRRHHAEHPHATVPGKGTEALRVLDERFARGEIDPDDYKVRRDLLNGHIQPTPA